MKTIFAIVCNQTASNLVSNKFFQTKEAARHHLKELADQREHNLGVRHFKKTEDEFSFVLGWESADVRFHIVELPLEDGDKQ